MKRKIFIFFLILLKGLSEIASAACLDYTVYPPFISQTVPPLVMLVMAKDHKLFYKAYNDVMDLDDDGIIDSTYKDTINYYGYFDPHKCYTYRNDRFEPVGPASGPNRHYCSGAWSGNFMNWATMSRIDILRKVLYGGKRSVDTPTTTVLSRAILPRDAHSWAKVYNGSDIRSLIPYPWDSVTICNTNTASTEYSLIMVKKGYFPYAASTEGRQCTSQYPGGPELNPDYIFRADVLVCDPSKGLEPNCLKYYQGNSAPSYKPVGLLQKFGLNRHGTDDTSDDTVQMYFGLISGSYDGNVSGGVLRSNLTDISATEIDNATGIVKSTSKIIKNIDNFKIIQYNYNTGWYDIGGTEGTCVPREPTVLTDGTCKSWGNPIGEMFYETIRYFQGKAAPTPQFDKSDSGLPLTKESQWCNPYAGGGSCRAFPSCAKPFALILSDIFPSYDSDQLPGSYWYSSISTSDTPSVQTLIDNANMNTLEGIGNIFVGQSAGTYDRQCTPKPGNFKSIRGLCVEEPTKQGSYYIAGLANYARTTDLNPAPGDQKMITYVVATSSPLPNLEFNVGGKKAVIIPIFHDGCPNTSLPGCASQGAGGDNSKGQLVDFQICQNDDDWRAEQRNGYQYCYDIMWDDAEYGWDYDLDIRYRIYVKTGGGTITVKTRGLYAAAGHLDYAGYFITGVAGAGEYYDIACGNNSRAGFRDCDRYDQIGNPFSSPEPDPSVERTFTVTGSTTGFLKNPLWYAAKYGGYTDLDGSRTPNIQSEWDRDSDGVPDTYFYAANPLKLEGELSRALTDILNRASSGTAVSILASGEGQGANLLQAVFYPKKTVGDKEISWIGAMQNLWYYIDPLFQLSTIREDTDQDKKLNLINDYIANIYFDQSAGQTLASRCQDTDGDGDCDSVKPTIKFEEIKNLWEAGIRLFQKSPAQRRIYTNYNGLRLFNSSLASDATFRSYLQAANETEATNIINYIRGTDIPNYRSRTVTLNIGGTNVTNTWKLGDIVHSTPKVQSWVPLNNYHTRYSDNSYYRFIQDKNEDGTDKPRKLYTDRGMVYVGANDGMLHAFYLGKLKLYPGTGTLKAELLDVSATYDPGDEVWSFIPKNALPYLKYLMDPHYCHLYYVDGSPYLFDASIGMDPSASNPAGCTETNYWDCIKTTNTWRTVLIGSMNLGGACRNTGSTCTDCVKTPVANIGYSSYFALDITDQENPRLLWEFSDPALGFSTSGPVVFRVGPPDKNGRWFVMFASGPTGPIDTTTHEFKGKSDQNLKLFILDLKTGQLLTTIDTGIQNAFGGSILNTAVDLNDDYQDDVIYIPYSKLVTGRWEGGILRLIIDGINPSSPDFTNRLSKVITTSGPVTSAPVFLRSKRSHELWLYFGTGRYFYKTDDLTGRRKIYGIKEPCYLITDTIDTSCTREVSEGSLSDATSSIPSSIGNGWYINLDCASGDTGCTYTAPSGYGAERVITTPLASPAGAVFFTTFSPTSDICGYGGRSYVWAVNYRTGGVAPSAALQGKALLQLSTGEIKEIDLKTAFTERSPSGSGSGGRRSVGFFGVPPQGQGLSGIVPPDPIKRFIFIKEK